MTKSEIYKKEESVWTEKEIPDLSNKTIIITGSNAGLGKETAIFLGQHNATIILACRSIEKGLAAEKEIRKLTNSNKIKFMQLDLMNFQSIQNFSEAFHQQYTNLDILINNAGIYKDQADVTVDGYESVFGTNHLGHFYLTALLFDLLLASTEARIIIVSSIMHFLPYSEINYSLIREPKKHWYIGANVYSQSKLANLLFAHELHRQCQEAKLTNIKVISCHPGISATDIQKKASEESWVSKFGCIFSNLLAQDSKIGCLTTCYAATSPNAESGKYYGPNGWFAIKGYPTLEEPNYKAKNEEEMKKLWKISEELCHIEFKIPPSSNSKSDSK